MRAVGACLPPPRRRGWRTTCPTISHASKLLQLKAHSPRPLLPCMFNAMTSDKGSAAGGFREWAIQLVGGSCLRRDCHGVPEGTSCIHQDVGAAGRRADDKTGRPICYQRLDLEQEQRAPVLCLVKTRTAE